MFNDIIIDLLDESFHKVSVIKKFSNHKPWITSAIKKSIVQKNKLYHMFIKSPTPLGEYQYKCRNKLKYVIKFGEKSHYN